MKTGRSPPKVLSFFKTTKKLKMKLISLLFIIIVVGSCKKSNNDCLGNINSKIGFQIYEQVGDTLLPTDTAYEGANIFFKTDESYSNIKWKIGNDPREFNTPIVNLRFNKEETITTTLNAIAVSMCQPKIDVSQQAFSIIRNDGSKVSPIVGTFIGSNVDDLSDSFIVEVKFWYGTRYSWWNNGAYSIHNLPYGYKDSSQNFNGFVRPEIDGIVCSNGYKNLSLDKSGFIPAKGIKGYCILKQGIKDTLLINYTVIDIVKYNQNRLITYITKKFIGLRKKLVITKN